MNNRTTTTQFCDSYHSSKCVGIGNDRKCSVINARVRRQVNKKRRLILLKDTNKEIEDM